MMMDLELLERRYRTVLSRVQSASERGGRRSDEVTVVAVSKTFPVSHIEALYDLGQRDFGENKVQELRSKQAHFKSEETCPDIRWHLIGTLQRKKVRQIVDSIHTFHALDRVDLASEIEKRMTGQRPLDCFLQVNISREGSKHGFFPEDLHEALHAIVPLSSIRVIGLMGMAAPHGGERRLREQFAELRNLRDHPLTPPECRYLSMGMSEDYEIAIEEGASHVRVGSGIFGSRTYPDPPPTTALRTDN